jgi:2-oxoglutarate ferredoxin oxidoreductase subunit beta
MQQLAEQLNFKNNQEIKWCPGCGDYAILASLQKVLSQLGIPKENFAFISGIGCSGRLPHYLDVFGFHTIHGRAIPIATGLKTTRPELSVWVITGDGDALSIGSNHLLHALRRNVDIKIILINNKIYGLTKGQYSPTSDKGTVSPTSPHGSEESSLNPISFALNAGATFVARAIDTDAERLQQILLAAAQHRGSALIEIYQNCFVFNNNAFSAVRDKTMRDENAVFLQHGQPLIFGKNHSRRVVMQHLQLAITENKLSTDPADVLLHDNTNLMLAYHLSKMQTPNFPIPFGIFFKTQQNCYQANTKTITNDLYTDIVAAKQKSLSMNKKTKEMA